MDILSGGFLVKSVDIEVEEGQRAAWMEFWNWLHDLFFVKGNTGTLSTAQAPDELQRRVAKLRAQYANKRAKLEELGQDVSSMPSMFDKGLPTDRAVPGPYTYENLERAVILSVRYQCDSYSQIRSTVDTMLLKGYMHYNYVNPTSMGVLNRALEQMKLALTEFRDPSVRVVPGEQTFRIVNPLTACKYEDLSRTATSTVKVHQGEAVVAHPLLGAPVDAEQEIKLAMQAYENRKKARITQAKVQTIDEMFLELLQKEVQLHEAHESLENYHFLKSQYPDLRFLFRVALLEMNDLQQSVDAFVAKDAAGYEKSLQDQADLYAQKLKEMQDQHEREMQALRDACDAKLAAALATAEAHLADLEAARIATRVAEEHGKLMLAAQEEMNKKQTAQLEEAHREEVQTLQREVKDLSDSFATRLEESIRNARESDRILYDAKMKELGTVNEELRKEIEQLQKSVRGLESKVARLAALQAERDALEAERDSLLSLKVEALKVPGLQSSIDTLKAEVMSKQVEIDALKLQLSERDGNAEELRAATQRLEKLQRQMEDSLQELRQKLVLSEKNGAELAMKLNLAMAAAQDSEAELAKCKARVQLLQETVEDLTRQLSAANQSVTNCANLESEKLAISAQLQAIQQELADLPDPNLLQSKLQEAEEKAIVGVRYKQFIKEMLQARSSYSKEVVDAILIDVAKHYPNLQTVNARKLVQARAAAESSSWWPF